MTLSVIIPAYNEERFLSETLQHVADAVAVANCSSEVIVVDNDSTDRTGQIATDFGARVVTETRHNISIVRNTGAKNATGELLVFLDADTRIAQTLLQKIVQSMEDARCLGGAVAVDYEQPRRWFMELYLSCWAFWGRVFNMKQGAAQFCRRPVFEKIAGYDESIFVGEDIDFYWRLSRFARKNDGYLNFIEHPRVLTSVRRFDRTSLWKTLVVTHPILILCAWRKKSVWKDWYEHAVR